MSKRGEFYRHDEPTGTPCKQEPHFWRVVECCPKHLPDETDVLECAYCGETRQVRCDFGEDMA